MGIPLFRSKDYEKAYTLWILAYDLSSELNGKDSEETADCLCKLAIICRELKKNEEYFKFAKLSYEVYREVLGPKSEKTIDALFRYGMSHTSIDKIDDSLELMKSALKLW